MHKLIKGTFLLFFYIQIANLYEDGTNLLNMDSIYKSKAELIQPW